MKFENNEIFEAHKLVEMPVFHQLYKATSETDTEGMRAFYKTMADYRRKEWPYVVTINRTKVIPYYQMYIEGYECKPCEECKKPREFDGAGWLDICEFCSAEV